MENIIVPKSWDQITIGQFCELQNIDLSQYDSSLAINLEKLAILTNTSADDEIWDEMNVIELYDLVNSLHFLNSTPTSKYKYNIENTFIKKEFNTLTFGEFIDIEYFINEGLLENFTKILAILYRKYKKGEWGELILEPYDVIDINKRAEEFEDYPITYVFGIIDDFGNFKKEFMTKYEALFEPVFEDEEQEYSEEELMKDPILAQEIENEKKFEEKQKKWSWERLLFKLAEGDILKVNEITKQGIIYIFNMLAMTKELGL